MKIEEAIEFALSGKALLFTGAGFSIDAQNLRGKSFLTGSQLAEYLATSSGLDEKTSLRISLDSASEEYITLHGVDKLIDELQQEFTAKTITSAQSQIATIPWKRIYTTNYDNILEKAYTENGKKLVPITSSDQLRNTPKNSTVCVHLNGYIDRLNRSTITSEFKLTDTSYSTASIMESPWSTLLRDDIQSSRSVFFVGYSLADLDIKRILNESEGLIEKCFFVLGNSPDNLTVNKCSRFGQVLKLDTTSFATETKNIAKRYNPPLTTDFSSSYIEKYQIPDSKTLFSDENVFSLFLQGNIDSSFLASSFSGGIKYFLERHEIKETLELLQYKPTSIVFHSELGNGKTLLVEGLKSIRV